MAGWCRKRSAPKRGEGRAQKEERREKQEESDQHDEDESLEMAMVRPQKGGMVQKRVGPSGRGGQSAERRAQREASRERERKRERARETQAKERGEQREKREEGTDKGYKRVVHSTLFPTTLGPAECAKRLNNEQLHCNCTATGFALSRVCILIAAKGRSSLARSRWPDAQIEVAVAKWDLRKEQQREKRENIKEKREERWFGHRKARW